METLTRPRADQDSESWIGEALEWVLQAGEPYFDWFFGGAEAARRAVEAWMHRPSSEVHVGRIQFLMEGDRPLGGFLALTGAELAKARMADAMAAMKLLGRDVFSQRVEAARGLFPDVSPDEHYLSKIGVQENLRQRGFGTELVHRWLSTARKAGYTKMRLDVSEDNQVAVRMYLRLGFRIDSRNSAAGLNYLSMILD